MTTLQDYPALNGIAPSWADAAFTFSAHEGQSIDDPDLQGLNLKDDVEVGVQRKGGRVFARTSGQVTSETSLTFYQSGFRKLVRSLLSKAPRRGNEALVSLVGFDILYQGTPPGEIDIYVIKVLGCRLLGRSWAMAEGPDAQLVEVPISTIKIIEVIDGLDVVLL